MANKKKGKAARTARQQSEPFGDPMALVVADKTAQAPADIAAAARASVREPSPTDLGGGHILGRAR